MCEDRRAQRHAQPQHTHRAQQGKCNFPEWCALYSQCQCSSFTVFAAKHANTVLRYQAFFPMHKLHGTTELQQQQKNINMWINKNMSKLCVIFMLSYLLKTQTVFHYNIKQNKGHRRPSPHITLKDLFTQTWMNYSAAKVPTVNRFTCGRQRVTQARSRRQDSEGPACHTVNSLILHRCIMWRFTLIKTH